jgi:cytochrome b involved in lipid metabolism
VDICPGESMGVIALTVFAASLIYLCFYPPVWMYAILERWRYGKPTDISPKHNARRHGRTDVTHADKINDTSIPAPSEALGIRRTENAEDGVAMARGHLTTPKIAIAAPVDLTVEDASDAEEEQTTPKATAAFSDVIVVVPASADEPSQPDSQTSEPQNGGRKTPSPVNHSTPAILRPTVNGSLGSTMLPPPVPQRVVQPRIPSLNPLPNQSTLSAYPSQRNLPLPNRGPSAQAPATSTLAPPPTITSKPTPPRRPVTLTAGHSPLDWARLSSDPSQNLSGLPAGVSYLRIAPSQLKAQNGRKGKDAWMVLGGLVYNVTPYLPFHPGGVPELMRGAGRNGTKLFGEIHPWVNYEGMLASCLVGRLVEEGQGTGQGVSEPEGEMDMVD